MVKSNRDSTFDIMKGIGIILVITCHFFGWNHPLMDRVINSFHMPMFFIVAGYFSKPHIDSLIDRNNIKKYIRRLLPAFVFTQLLIVCWSVLMAVSGNVLWDKVVSDFLSVLWADPFGPMTPWGKLSIGVIWFLLSLLIAKIILIPLSRTGGWAIPISLVLAYVAILLHSVWPYSILCSSHGIVALPFVTIGWWVRNIKIPNWFVLPSLVCWVLALTLSSMDMFEMNWTCYPVNVIGACGGTYCLYVISKGIDKYTGVFGKVLAVLGLWSLAIMCAHCFEMASHLGNHVMGITPFDYPVWAKYTVRYVVTIALAAALYYFPLTKKIFS